MTTFAVTNLRATCVMAKDDESDVTKCNYVAFFGHRFAGLFTTPVLSKHT